MAALAGVAKRRKIGDGVEFSEDVLDQIRVYDARYVREAAAALPSTSGEAQRGAFGGRDGTGVEAVHDAMDTEAAALRECVRRCAPTAAGPAVILDFGCGDGRYLAEFLRISREIGPLRVIAMDISPGALRTLRARAAGLGCQRGVLDEPPSELWGSSKLAWDSLEVVLQLADGVCEVDEVEARCREAIGGVADIVVCGWGTLSSIPPRHGASRQEPFLAAFRRLGKCLVNVVSNKRANHVKPQRRFAAMRRAFADPDLPSAAREWLRRRLRMALLPDTYYYPVGSGPEREWLFYSGISEAQETQRLRAAGFSNVEVRICNIINFFDILTKPRAARLNRAVIALLSRGRLLEAQLLLSRAAAKATRRSTATMRTAPLFDAKGVKDQVARYFVSVAS